MKTILLKHSVIVGILLVSGIVFAQPNNSVLTEKDNAATTANKVDVTSNPDETSAVLNGIQQHDRDRLRESLTQEQVSILIDESLTREERRQAFLEALSDDQKDMLNQQNREQTQLQIERAEMSRNQIRTQQREQITDNADGEEVRQQQREQIREQSRDQVHEEQAEREREHSDNETPYQEPVPNHQQPGHDDSYQDQPDYYPSPDGDNHESPERHNTRERRH